MLTSWIWSHVENLWGVVKPSRAQKNAPAGSAGSERIGSTGSGLLQTTSVPLNLGESNGFSKNSDGASPRSTPNIGGSDWFRKSTSNIPVQSIVEAKGASIAQYAPAFGFLVTQTARNSSFVSWGIL
jgi:hypothetical protein